MKLLMVYADRFAYKTTVKTLKEFEDQEEERSAEGVLVGFIHVEEEDEERLDKVETKLVKNLKWAAKKNGTNTIVLHSFAHLSESKGDPKITKGLLDRAEKRLVNAGYEAWQTPFGYFLDLDMKAPGRSLARVFKEF